MCTLLRQVALIIPLAQIGSFVPARSAELPLIDRIFTRIGASDNIARGESTFMVEMKETANILRDATPKSIIILDEIGRGTSTFDGLSIAWAVIEYLHDRRNVKAKTLFATHYHELIEIARTKHGVKNFNVLVSEHNGEVTFLRKLAPGGASRSYGIEVAKIAMLPQKIIRRANEILDDLETTDRYTQEKNMKENVEGGEIDKLKGEISDIESEVENYRRVLGVIDRV